LGNPFRIKGNRYHVKKGTYAWQLVINDIVLGRLRFIGMTLEEYSMFYLNAHFLY